MKTHKSFLRFSAAIILALSIYSCEKKVHYKGTVVSKHKFPVKGAKVLIQVGDMYGSMRNDTEFEGKTDESGNFKITGKVCRKCTHEEINVWSDSGFVEHVVVNDPMNIRIEL